MNGEPRSRTLVCKPEGTCVHVQQRCLALLPPLGIAASICKGVPLTEDADSDGVEAPEDAAALT